MIKGKLLGIWVIFFLVPFLSHLQAAYYRVRGGSGPIFVNIFGCTAAGCLFLCILCAYRQGIGIGIAMHQGWRFFAFRVEYIGQHIYCTTGVKLAGN